MLYAIICEDVPNSLPLRVIARPAHMVRLHEMAAQDRIVLVGPHPAIDSENPGDAGFTGSLMILKFDSLEDAQQWAEADPYVSGGVFAKVTVKPFKQVLP